MLSNLEMVEWFVMTINHHPIPPFPTFSTSELFIHISGGILWHLSVREAIGKCDKNLIAEIQKTAGERGFLLHR